MNNTPVPSDLYDLSKYPGGVLDSTMDKAFTSSNRPGLAVSNSDKYSIDVQRELSKGKSVKDMSWQPTVPNGFLDKPILSTADTEQKIAQMKIDADTAESRAAETTRSWN
jgi:hypothetical protein